MKGTSRRRHVLCVGAGLLVFFLLLGAAHPTARKLGADYYAGTDSSGTGTNADGEPKVGPPNWDALRKWEAELPQHDLDLPFPEGHTGRFVKFSNEARYIGWNNCFNEELMNAHLAYVSQRAYVFSPYIWAPQHYRWPSHAPPGGARTPLNAIISGPMAGGPWDAGDPAPRSVSADFFDVVCPPSERRIINTRDVKPQIPGDAGGDVVLAHWAKVLREAPERCVEVVPPPFEEDSFPQTFDLGVWGSKRILSLWESFSQSPTSQLLGPSPIVAAAVERNAYLFFPRAQRPPVGIAPGTKERMGTAYDPFASTLAIHVRRGDYLAHCRNLAEWGSTYYSWAQLPSLPDHYAPTGEGEARVQEMLRHCLPDMQRLVKRIGEVRAEYIAAGKERVLDTLFLLTNEQGEWITQLKNELRRDGWSSIVASGDLVLDAEAMDVSMAVDMEVARRAGVFVGNGWSSFTSNIVHQRLVDGREPISIRMT
ncbi:hypothetical protein FB451DRAFT_1041630 [Mycena latifolia]|nr:hypothetical protein FB451DRAFT_1041630 [Mycena latifolia]